LKTAMSQLKRNLTEERCGAGGESGIGGENAAARVRTWV